MANSNRTEIYIEGSKEAIDNFVERFEKCHSGPYPNQEENPTSQMNLEQMLNYLLIKLVQSGSKFGMKVFIVQVIIDVKFI